MTGINYIYFNYIFPYDTMHPIVEYIYIEIKFIGGNRYGYDNDTENPC